MDVDPAMRSDPSATSKRPRPGTEPAGKTPVAGTERPAAYVNVVCTVVLCAAETAARPKVWTVVPPRDRSYQKGTVGHSEAS
jgi:hypothetical protein